MSSLSSVSRALSKAPSPRSLLARAASTAAPSSLPLGRASSTTQMLNKSALWPSRSLTTASGVPVCLSEAYDPVEGKRYLLVSALGVRVDLKPEVRPPASASASSPNTSAGFGPRIRGPRASAYGTAAGSGSGSASLPKYCAAVESSFHIPFVPTNQKRVLPGTTTDSTGTEYMALGDLASAPSAPSGGPFPASHTSADSDDGQLENLMREMGASESSFVDANLAFPPGTFLSPTEVGLTARGVKETARFLLPPSKEVQSGYARQVTGDGESFSAWRAAGASTSAAGGGGGGESMVSPVGSAVAKMLRRELERTSAGSSGPAGVADALGGLGLAHRAGAGASA